VILAAAKREVFVVNAMVNHIKACDLGLFCFINHRLNCLPLNIFMLACTQLGSITFSVAFPLLFLLSGKPELIVIGARMAIILSISEILVYVVKRLVNRPRPFKSLENVITWRLPSCRYSFPSGHTCAAFSITLALSYALPGSREIFWAIAALVGISRIYLGVHYPSDVLVGILIAYGSFLLEKSFFITTLFLS
jgi:undecaprenyl-diphosphatase